MFTWGWSALRAASSPMPPLATLAHRAATRTRPRAKSVDEIGAGAPHCAPAPSYDQIFDQCPWRVRRGAHDRTQA